MKKFLLTTLSCLLCICMASPALANGWGLRGGIYDIVSDTNLYDSYTAIADDGNMQLEGRHVNHAILRSRYHTVLIAAAREGKVWQAETISTTAVYQPDDERGKVVQLEHAGGSFVLQYGEPGALERYTFYYSKEDGEYILGDVRYIPESEWLANSFMHREDGMLFWQSGPEKTFLPIGDALWLTDGVTLSEFNIVQMPRSISEVRNLNRTAQALQLRAENLQIREVYSGQGKKRSLAVYSAPDEASYRSGSGKASVSTGGEIEIYGTVDGWTLIGYEVSSRTNRIGYVAEELVQDQPLTFAQVPLVTQADTFLTDDPFVSQYAQAALPKGTEITGLAQCGEYYAYAECTLDGALYRGFVPLKDLMTKYDHTNSTWYEVANGTALLMAEVRWDVTDALVGKWFEQGGSSRELLILDAEGGFRTRSDGHNQEVGNFRVYDAENSDGSTYEIFFLTEGNQEARYTLRLNEDGSITLSNDRMETVLERNEYSTFGNG